MHVRNSQSRYIQNSTSRKSYDEVKKRASKYLNLMKVDQLAKEYVEDVPVQVKEQSNGVGKHLGLMDEEQKDGAQNPIHQVNPANPSPANATPTRLKGDGDNAVANGTGKQLFESKSFNGTVKAESPKKPGSYVKVTINDTKNDISGTMPLAEQIFSGIDDKKTENEASDSEPSFTLRIARTRRDDGNYLTRSMGTTTDISKSLIEKKGYFIDNDSESLTNQQELLQKKLEDLRKMQQNLRRENTDLKTELLEEKVSRRDIDKKLLLVQKRLKGMDTSGQAFKKMKAQERILILERNLKEVKTLDASPLFSKLVSMTKRHASELRSTCQELDRAKEQNETEKSRLSSQRLAKLADL